MENAIGISTQTMRTSEEHISQNGVSKMDNSKRLMISSVFLMISYKRQVNFAKQGRPINSGELVHFDPIDSTTQDAGNNPIQNDLRKQ